MLHSNRRATRRSFGRRALAFGVAMFAMVALTAVGFAAWLISSNSTSESTGGIVTQEVSQANIKITMTNTDEGGSLYATETSQISESDILYNSETHTGDKFDIVFGLPKGATTGLVTYDNKGGKDKPENLKFYFEGYVENWDRVGEFKFSVKVPDVIVEAAGYVKSDEKWTYDNANAKNAYVELPSYALDAQGNSLPLVVGGEKQGEDKTAPIVFKRGEGSKLFDVKEISTGATDDLKITLTENQTVLATTATVTKFNGWMAFKWGARYNNINPATTFNSKNSNDWKNVAKTGITHELKDGSTTTLAANIPNQVHLELLKLQCAVNGEKIADYYAAEDIILSGSQTIEDYVKGDNTAVIAGQLGVLQAKLGEKIYAATFKKPTYKLLIEAIVR